MQTGQKTAGESRKLVSIPQVRLIELVAIFCILYVAGELAGFSYRSGLLAAVFIGSALANLGLSAIGEAAAGTGPSARPSGRTWNWATVFADLATVLALIYLTGTATSPFLFLVVVPLFFAGRLIPSISSGFIVTFAAIAAIAAMGLLEIRGVIPHHACFPEAGPDPAGPDQLMGTLLVLGGFMSLMTYLFGTFYENFHVYFRTAEDRIRSSKRRILELTRLYDISLGINSVISLDTLLKMVCKEVTLLLRRPWAAVALVSQKHSVVKFVELDEDNVTSIDPDGELDGDPLIARVLEKKEGLRIDCASACRDSERSRLACGKGLGPVLAVPIHSGREAQGVLLVGDRGCARFEEEDINLLSILSGQVATAIEKSRLYEVMSGRIKRLERENENLGSSNNLKMGYISHLSHELKTPLTSIKAYVESLAEHIGDPDFREGKDFLGVISNETDRLIRMVNKVLDISKIEFGQRSLRRSPFDLAALVDEVRTSMRPYLGEKDLELVVDLPGGMPRVDGDQDLVKQVFINLIGNAIKFSPQGSRICLEVVEEAVSIKVRIRDQGVGIPEEDLKKIFRQFYQVQGAVSEGVGLGLAIVKNIVEQHGGYIQVESSVGEGATFTFSLPKEHHFNDLLGFIFDSMEAKEEIQEMFQLAVKVVAEMLSAKIVSLMLLDGDRKELFIKVAYGLEEEIVEKTRVRVGRSIAGKVAQTGEPLLIEDIEQTEMTGTNNPQYETKSLISVPLVVGSTIIGVINVNNKTSGDSFTEDDLVLLTSISQRISKVVERMRTAEDFHAFLRETIASLRSLLEICERDEGGVRRRMVGWSVKVARKLGLSEKETRVIQFVSSVHDVGMTTISDSVLGKTLALTPQEIEEIRKHPQRGAVILRPLEFVELVSQTMLFHHERIDGRGYPMGLKGEQIPVGARILAVLDAWASMTGPSAFRDPIDAQEAVRELVANAGTQFDAKIVGTFLDVLVDEGTIDIETYAGIRERLRFGGRHHAMP